MKRTFLKTLATLSLCATCFTACAGTNQKVSFSDYWRADSISKQDLTETLEYEVKYESNNITSAYTLNYTNGKYVTQLSTATEADGRKVYIYKTELTITATYVFNGEVAECNDTVKTEVKFEQSSSLRPIYSRKEIKSSSPTESLSSDPTQLSQCFNEYDYTIETTYSGNAGAGNSKITLNGEEPRTSEDSFTLDTEKFTYLDNEQLLFAIRGMRASANVASTFMVYSPFAKTGQKIKTTFSAKEGTEFSFLRDGIAVKETIEYFPTSIVLDAKNPGATQTAWYAATTNPQDNTYRNVMLRLETPVSYSHGTLIYTLKSANFAK